MEVIQKATIHYRYQNLQKSSVFGTAELKFVIGQILNHHVTQVHVQC